MRRWDDIECPACGSADIDLAETIPGPLFACQECGHAFDPEDEFDLDGLQSRRCQTRRANPRVPWSGSTAMCSASLRESDAACAKTASQSEPRSGSRTRRARAPMTR